MSDKSKALANDDIRLDAIMKELDEAIAVIDAGETEIEEAIATYEHASALIQLAAQRLATIEQRVESLNRTAQTSDPGTSETD